jgi:DNA-binding CsgD family transcriptional regulator
VTTHLLGLNECAPDSPAVNPLSRRESEVLRALAEGHTQGWIADKAALSAKTVSTIVEQIRHKLNANTTPHAVHIAHRIGVLR